MTINFNDVTDTATPTSGTFNTGGNANVRGSGQNFLTYSQQIGGTNWVNSNTTSTLNNATAPDNTLTATSLVESATTAQHFVSQAITFPANSNICFSAYVKFPLTTRAFGIQVTDAPAGGSSYAAIDVSYLGVAQTPTVSGSFTGITGSSTSVGNGWYRVQMSFKTGSIASITVRLFLLTNTYTQNYPGDGTSNIFVWGAQLELGSTANTYVPTTTAAIYGTPSLSFSGASTLGLQSDGSLFLQPAGGGALQAQATTSSAVGGNARGGYAVDWQTARSVGTMVASGAVSVISGGQNNSSTSYTSFVGAGANNTASGANASVVSGNANNASGQFAFIGAGASNTGAGLYNVIGGGFTNSGTANAAVTTQSATMNGTTAVTLSGSNANIKVGQFISGTSIGIDTYVAAISGTSLTLSKIATGSTTNTISFFTPHGVVVGGGNNQATGSYSFIGGGGDAGTAANRNVASGDWSVVGGGRNNTASGIASFIGSGGIFSGVVFANTASGAASALVGGLGNNSTGLGAFVGGGYNNLASGVYSTIAGGSNGTARSISGNTVFGASNLALNTIIGNCQAALLILAVQTTDATATALKSDGNAASTNNQVILPNNSAYYFKGSVIANVTGAANGAAWSIEGAIMRGANAASTVLIDTPSINRVAASAGATTWVVAVTADTTNGGLAVTVTGVASTTIRWVAKLETTEVTF